MTLAQCIQWWVEFTGFLFMQLVSLEILLVKEFKLIILTKFIYLQTLPSLSLLILLQRHQCAWDLFAWCTSRENNVQPVVFIWFRCVKAAQCAIYKTSDWQVSSVHTISTAIIGVLSRANQWLCCFQCLVAWWRHYNSLVMKRRLSPVIMCSSITPPTYSGWEWRLAQA